MSSTDLQSPQGRFNAQVVRMKKLIAEAVPLHQPPHDYMNIGLPLTAKEFRHQPGHEGEAVSKWEAMRHVLYLVEKAEIIARGDLDVAEEVLVFAQGILFANGVGFWPFNDVIALLAEAA